MLFVAVHESAYGTSRHFAAPQKSVAIGGKADIRPGSSASMTLGNMRANGIRLLVSVFDWSA
jgi:hypothetical protein